MTTIFNMKRIVVFFMLINLLLLLPFDKQSFLPLYKLHNTEQICFVCEKEVDINNKLVENLIENGGVKYLYTSKENALALSKKLRYSSVEFYLKNISLSKLKDILDFTTLKIQTLNETIIVYGYSSFYTDYIYMDNKRVNVQLAIKNDDIIAGFPLIVTGF